MLARAYHRTFGLNVTVSNCSNNYGPKQHPEKLIPKIVSNALAGKEIPIYGDGKTCATGFTCWITAKQSI